MHKPVGLVTNLALSLVSLIAGAVLGALIQNALNARALSWGPAELILIFICLAIISMALLALFARLADLDNRIGVKVRYVEQDEGRAHLFRELKSLADKAERSIFIVNTFQEERRISESDKQTLQERRAYYESLIEKSRTHVRYRRILQIDSDSPAILSHASEDYLHHFHRMIDEKERGSSQVGLFKAPAIRPMTFILIDDRWLLLQVDQRDGEGRLYMHGILIFEDPQQLVIRYFQEFFQRIDANTQGGIQRTELPPRPNLG